MSVHTRARGTLTFPSPDAAEQALRALDDDDEDVREVVAASVKRDGATLHVDIDADFNNADNLTFQIWLEDLAEEAVKGHLDTWQEDFGPNLYVRVHAGGEETERKGPFPKT